MSIRSADRLSFRLLITCMVCAMVVGIGLSAGQIVLDARNQSAEIDRNTEQVLAMLRQPATEAAWNIDPVLARQVLDGLARYESLSGATLVAYPSDELAIWQREARPGALRAVTDAIFGAERSHVLPLQVEAMPDPVGELRVQVDTYPAGRAFLDRAAVVVLAGILRSLVLALALAAIFYVWLTRPLSRMVETLSNVDPQAPQRMRLPSIQGHERDELGTWIESANKLLQSIEDHIARREKAEAKAEYLQQFDRLTDLPNRTLFYDRLDQAIRRARPDQRHVAVLMCDVRDFQHINDQHGQDTGDAVLREVAARIRRLAGDGVTVARLSGDQFAVLLENLEGPDPAEGLAQRIVQEGKSPLAIGAHAIEARLCAGIALYPDDGEQPDALTRNAEEALNMAKKAGRSQVSFYVVELGARMRARRELVHDLERALERNELQLQFHPQFNTATHQLVGAEALLRWMHPVRGQVPPATFVPLAEESGLIVEIGRWVMEQACRHAQEWSDFGLPPLRVAVNVSAAQFEAKGGIGRLVSDQLSASGLDPRRLDIEITETAMMQNLDAAIAALQEVRESGTRLSVDDFGTGQSSLSYLLKLPVTALKIDQSFVRQLMQDANSTHIVNAIIGLGHSLKLAVIAEGVETGEQLTYLRAARCDEIQGYFLAQPLDAARFPSYALMTVRRPAQPAA
ncbi:MAG: putative bifunctional diguanylate cyclase/phosphodiesterase [Gammaproteobacteria bacterium]